MEHGWNGFLSAKTCSMIFDIFWWKLWRPKLLQVLQFLVTLRPENVLLDVDGHVRRGFCRVFSRFVMWCCEQRPLSHLRLTDFGLAKMGLRLDLDFFQVTSNTSNHMIPSSIKHIKHPSTARPKSHIHHVWHSWVFTTRGPSPQIAFFYLPRKKIFEFGWNNMKKPPVQVFKRQSYACELDWLEAQNLHLVISPNWRIYCLKLKTDYFDKIFTIFQQISGNSTWASSEVVVRRADVWNAGGSTTLPRSQRKQVLHGELDETLRNFEKLVDSNNNFPGFHFQMSLFSLNKNWEFWKAFPAHHGWPISLWVCTSLSGNSNVK